MSRSTEKICCSCANEIIMRFGFLTRKPNSMFFFASVALDFLPLIPFLSIERDGTWWRFPFNFILSIKSLVSKYLFCPSRNFHIYSIFCFINATTLFHTYILDSNKLNTAKLRFLYTYHLYIYYIDLNSLFNQIVAIYRTHTRSQVIHKPFRPFKIQSFNFEFQN